MKVVAFFSDDFHQFSSEVGEEDVYGGFFVYLFSCIQITSSSLLYTTM